MNPNIKPSARCALLGVVDPDAYSANSYSTAYVDMSKYESLLAVISVGTMGTNATVDAKLEQATTDGGTPKDITGKAITQLTEAGTDSDKQALINLMSEELDVANGYRWVRLTITSAVASVDLAGFLLGFDARYTPAHAATVDETVG